MKPCIYSQCSGFLLIELLLALMVFSIFIVSLWLFIVSMAEQQANASLYRKGLLIARSTLAQRQAGLLPPSGSKDTDRMRCTWRLEQVIAEARGASLQQVTISRCTVMVTWSDGAGVARAVTLQGGG